MKLSSFIINDLGTITVIIPKTKRALSWLKNNLHTESWQWDGSVLSIDSRYAEDIINALA